MINTGGGQINNDENISQERIWALLGKSVSSGRELRWDG